MSRATLSLRLPAAILLLLGALGLAFSAPPLDAAESPAPRIVSLHGAVTNTTADIAAKARIVLTIAGETVTATLKTEAPLTGSGRLEGRLRNGWIELAGKLDEGFTIQFRGALNARDFRGTYIAVVPGTPLQYGKFQLAVEK